MKEHAHLRTRSQRPSLPYRSSVGVGCRARASPNARRPDFAELARERFHGTALRRHLQRLFRGLVPERQRNEAVVAGGVEIELQLRAPKPTVSYQRTLRRSRPSLTAVECLVQLRQPTQARREHRLVRAVARIRPIQQRHMPRLADQDAKPYHPEVLSLALGVSTPGQFAWRLRVDVRIEVRRVEREHVRGKLEPGNGSFRDRYLRLLQLMLGHLLRDAMKPLPAERGSRQTRQARQTRIQKFPQLALGSGRARPLNRHCHSQLAYRWAALRANLSACPI